MTWSSPTASSTRRFVFAPLPFSPSLRFFARAYLIYDRVSIPTTPSLSSMSRLWVTRSALWTSTSARSSWAAQTLSPSTTPARTLCSLLPSCSILLSSPSSSSASSTAVRRCVSSLPSAPSCRSSATSSRLPSFPLAYVLDVIVLYYSPFLCLRLDSRCQRSLPSEGRPRERVPRLRRSPAGEPYAPRAKDLQVCVLQHQGLIVSPSNDKFCP